MGEKPGGAHNFEKQDVGNWHADMRLYECRLDTGIVSSYRDRMLLDGSRVVVMDEGEEESVGEGAGRLATSRIDKLPAIDFVDGNR